MDLYCVISRTSLAHSIISYDAIFSDNLGDAFESY